MTRAYKLNKCAHFFNEEKQSKRIKYTKDWIDTVLFPALNHHAETGNYNFYLHKVYNYGIKTWVFDDLTYSEDGLDIDLVINILKENGFYVEQDDNNIYTISWEDRYIHE